MTTGPRQTESSVPVLPEIPNWICLSLLAAITVGMLAKPLLFSPHEVLSDGRMDLSYFFVHWRYFGFHELKSANLALWNPHYYCGAPFFGNFQSALLYPLNFLYLLAPLDAAINWTIALHVLLGGVFTFYWVRGRGLHSLAALLSALMFMFCGPHFLQIQAGHLPNLCTLIWAPLLFLAIDQLMDRPALLPCLLGNFAFAMSILAGHPQYVFYMGVAAGIYAVLNLVRAPHRGKIMLGLGGIVAGGICLGAVQLFTGLDEGREGMRSLGLSYESASTFSFPPENFLTLVAPWCFGDAISIAYVGRWFVTDVSLFVSVMGLALAVCGMAAGARATRRFSITMLVITLVLAMGGYTPVFHFLFNYVPGFNLFRGTDKFLWLAALFLSMLAGIGLDRLLRGWKVSWWIVGGVAGAGIVVCFFSSLPRQLDWWLDLITKFRPDTMPLEPVADYIGPNIVERSSAQCVGSLILGAVSLFLAAGFLALTKLRRRIACGGMLLMAVIELACFAGASLVTFPIDSARSPFIDEILAKNPGDYRVKCENPNRAMTTGALDISGADPSGLLRFARYASFTAGVDFDTADYANAPEKKPDPLAWRMLRCRYLISESKSNYTTLEGALPRLMLVDRFRLMTNYHEMFSTLTNANFHIDEEIILENKPEPVPQQAREKGTVRLVKSSTDEATIEADVKTPCLLLMTDTYSKGWRALALPGGSQSKYEIMPANYCLRAIPLAAGHHLLRVEYSPLGFRIGKVVSIVAWPVFIVMAGLALVQKSQWKRIPKIETGPRAAL